MNKAHNTLILYKKKLSCLYILFCQSDRCHLSGLSPEELIAKGEHSEEWGGYFILKGHERIIRMLLMTRRNFPFLVRRNGWKQRGEQFSDLGVMIRCVSQDQTVTVSIKFMLQNN